MPLRALPESLKVKSPRTETLKIGLEQNGYYGTDFNFDLSNISSFVNLFNPTLCFSFNNLNGDTTTKIIRVRRASDNLEGDVYADNSGVVSPASNVVTAQSTITLQTFAAATNCFITKWYNQAKNVDGTRNTNDLFNTITSQQPKIWDSTTGLLKSFNANTPELRHLGIGFTTILNLTEAIDTNVNEHSSFSLLLIKSGTPGTSDNIFGGGSNSFLGTISPARFYLDQKIRYDFEDVATISQQINSGAVVQQTVGTLGSKTNQILEFYEGLQSGSSTGRRLHMYGNQNYSYVDTAGISRLRPNNSTGFRALPGGWIQSDGIRVEEGYSAYFLADYDALLPNFYAFINIFDTAIGTNSQNLAGAGSLVTTTGAPIRLATTTAPTSNPTIDGVTYTYITITSIGVTYYILTTNLSSSIYPDGSPITTVTTNAQWASTAATGVRRVYEGIYGAYYSHPVVDTIKDQGGYSAGGTTWTVLGSDAMISIGVTTQESYTIGNSGTANYATHLKFMYQLNDAEFAAAGSIGRWVRANDLSPNYRITRLRPFINDSTSLSTKRTTAGISSFIYFNRNVISYRSEISDFLNRKNLIYSKD
jgi:hypothetical protein